MNITPHKHDEATQNNHHHHQDVQAGDQAHSHPIDSGAARMDHGTHNGHEGHATMMRNRFLVSLPLTIVVLLYSPMIQIWFNFSMPAFPGSAFIAPILGTIIFIYGGLPFLSMARQELALRQPGMMTLISLAITTAFLYSLGIIFFPPVDDMGMQSGVMMDFFWEFCSGTTGA